MFDKFFDFPVSMCLIFASSSTHSFADRWLVIKKRRGLFSVDTVFVSHLLSLEVFLVCLGEFPDHYDPDSQPITKRGPSALWKKLIGSDLSATLVDVSKMLAYSANMSGLKKPGRALILIVDDVLIVTHHTFQLTKKLCPNIRRH